jgi:hypothetical protein
VTGSRHWTAEVQRPGQVSLIWVVLWARRGVSWWAGQVLISRQGLIWHACTVLGMHSKLGSVITRGLTWHACTAFGMYSSAVIDCQRVVHCVTVWRLVWLVDCGTCTPCTQVAMAGWQACSRIYFQHWVLVVCMIRQLWRCRGCKQDRPQPLVTKCYA